MGAAGPTEARVILSDEGIRQAIAAGDIEVDPSPQPDQYTTSAIDLFLGDGFWVWDKSKFDVPGVRVVLDLADQEFQRTARAYLVKETLDVDGAVVLPPYGSARCHPLLAITRERVHLKHGARVAARVEGRSSFARLGLLVHLTAPTIHAGCNGKITLEIINHGPFDLKLRPGRTSICQLIVERLESPPQVTIATAFQGQASPTGSGQL